MIADDHTGYGMKDGKLLFIADVPRGSACGCVCARCGQTLIAKKGSIRRHHFAHFKVTNCRGAVESVLHLLAKELIAELDVFVIPPYGFVEQRKTKTGTFVQHQSIVAKGGNVAIDSVRVEKNEGDFVPDIIIESGLKLLIVEVAVTHKVTRAKLRRIRHRNLPALEVRLDQSDSFLPRESLKIKLQQDLNSKVWLFHPRQRSAERIFFSKLRDALALDRAKLHRARRYVVAPNHPTKTLRRSVRSSLRPPLNEYDRTAEEFNRAHQRYPTMEECLQLWPDLWRP